MAKKIREDENRIMKVFNAETYDKIPQQSNKAMKIYLDFLNEKLVFPITGKHTQDTGPFQSETISIKLSSVSDLYDDFYGISVEGRAGRKKVTVPLVDFEPDNETDEGFQLVQDYKTWFCNW